MDTNGVYMNKDVGKRYMGCFGAVLWSLYGLSSAHSFSSCYKLTVVHEKLQLKETGQDQPVFDYWKRQCRQRCLKT